MHVNWAYGVVVSHPLRMRKALGSNPSVSISSVSTRKASELLACRFIFPTRIQQTSLHLISKDMHYCPARRSGDQWRSGSTSASHAKGGVFKPQLLQFGSGNRPGNVFHLTLALVAAIATCAWIHACNGQALPRLFNSQQSQPILTFHAHVV